MTHETTAPEPEGTTRRERPARRGGRALRIVSGVAVLGLTAGAVVAGTQLGTADARALPAVDVEVAPTPVTLECPGPVLLPQRTVRGDAAFDPAPVAPVVTVDAVTAEGSGAGALAVAPLGGGTALADLGAGGGAAHLADVAGPLVVRAEPRDDAPVAAATGASVVTDGDARGLAAASCRAPSSDDWLVGGATGIGSTSTLVLSNPGLTAAQVTLEVFGPNGPVEQTTAQHVVGPGATRTVDLGGTAAGQSALVVHVTVAGGQVAARVQDTAVLGFTPAGTDLVVPGSAPAARQVVTGLDVEASAVGASDAPVLRLLAPGDAATTAHVSLLGADGPVALPGADEVPLAPGEVVDVPLGGLPAGTWTAVVDADVPVVAAAVVSRSGVPGALDDEARVERAWSASTATDVHGVVALPRGIAARLVVAAVGQDDEDRGRTRATLRALDRDGTVLSEVPVTVDAGTTGAWDVADVAAGAVALELEPDGGTPLAWGVTLTVAQADGDLVAVLDPVPVNGRAKDRTVREDPAAARG
ncbi:DUF5719 family protein [Cellulomonas iranensis]|uniref:DUF5719 family protein n=1 Tax=Cellulomonas iranensis TaxID=76862 RepID=UPI0013D6E1E3|nr:DUF5719 family protein [Cellulomonas iranensis]